MNNDNQKKKRALFRKILLSGVLLFLVSGCTLKNNMGDISQLPFMPTRKQVTHEENINMSADKVFRLASSIKDFHLTNPWQFSVFYMNSDTNENHGVYAENFTRPFLLQRSGTTYWYTTRYDPENRVFNAILVDKGIVIGRYDVIVQETENKQARMTNSLMYTALNEDGVDMLGNQVEKKMAELLTLVSNSIKHKAETGNKLRMEAIERLNINPPEAFKANRVRTVHKVTVNGTPQLSFHMPGGPEEICWVPDWNFETLYTDTGMASRENYVCMENGLAPFMFLDPDLNVFWYVSTYDEENWIFNVNMNVSGEIVGRMEFDFDATGDGQTLWNMAITFTSLTENGNTLMKQTGKFLAEKTVQERNDRMTHYIGEVGRYHRETGKRAEMPFIDKMKIASSVIWAKLTN